MQKDSNSMQPSPRETRVAITKLHMGQYITYNWGDEEESSCSPWFPCHSSVTVVKEKKDQITPMCVANGDVEGSSALSNMSWPLFLETDTLIVRLMYPA